MRAGTLRERLTILAPTTTTDPDWGASESFAEVATVAANVVARAAAEPLKDQGVAAVTSYDIVIRYRSDVSSTNRLTWRGKTLEVVSAIDPDGRRRQLNIEAKETT